MRTSVLAKEESKLIPTYIPTYHMLLERFVRGSHSRMRDGIRPDRAVDIELLHHRLETLHAHLGSATLLEEKKRISDLGLLVSGGFFVELRGDESLNMKLKGVLDHNKEAKT